jgi:hypothetical protein
MTNVMTHDTVTRSFLLTIETPRSNRLHLWLFIIVAVFIIFIVGLDTLKDVFGIDLIREKFLSNK